ncbi:TIGR03085 family metal-binding protein [Mycolicibacterium phlei]
MTAAQRERAALVQTLREVGPGAPTLCGDWTTRDLAAHLVVRERRLDAAPGIMVPALAGYTDRVQRRTAQGSDYEELLDKVASGPPLYSPFKLLDPVANMGEMFIHHEDVRRAQPDWEPRPLDDQTVAALGRSLPFLARLTLAKAPARLVLRTPQGRVLATVGRGPEVTITGEAQEIVLFVSGRDQVRLEFGGPADAVAAVKSNRQGL